MAVGGSRTPFARWAATAAAMLCAVVSVWMIPGMLSAQHKADYFDADKAAELSVTATLSDVTSSTSGKHKNTWAGVQWDSHGEGAGVDTIELSDNDDVRGEVPADGRIPMVVWHGHVMRYEFADEWHTTDADPDRAITRQRSAVALFALAAAVLGRFVGHWWLRRRRVNHDHFLAGDLLVLPFALATAALAVTGHSTTLAFLAPATLGMLVISLIVLPAIPWMWEPGAPREPEALEPERTPHPDYDMRDRPIGRRLW
jgi:hypothetical protein